MAEYMLFIELNLQVAVFVVKCIHKNWNKVALLQKLPIKKNFFSTFEKIKMYKYFSEWN